MNSLVLPVINLSVLLIILFKVLKNPTVDFFKNRSIQLEKDLEEVQQLLRESKRKFEEYSQKTNQIDQEIDLIRKALSKELQELKSSTEARAKEQAALIIKNTEKGVVELQRETKAALVKELGLKLLNQLEFRLGKEMTQEDRQSLQSQLKINLENQSLNQV